MPTPIQSLPVDRRARQGGFLFLASLVIFFLSSILLYLLYAYARREERETLTPLPFSFLASTLSILVVSGMLHVACRAVTRDRLRRAIQSLWIALFAALFFIAVQSYALWSLLSNVDFSLAPNRGVMGMVLVLAILHALHVVGGIIPLGVVCVRAARGKYDHERNWGVHFAAQYWHFLDLVWLFMLAAFWLTSGGFRFGISP